MKDKKAFSERDYYHLGINIATLRQIHNESQEELGFAIGVSKSAIANYETGQRIADRDVLRAIAKHYNLTVSRLINGDFSKVSVKNDLLINDTENREMILGNLLPIIYSDVSMKNKHFKKAYKLHTEIFESVCSCYTPNLSVVEECTALYQKAVEENVYDACANLLWWPMYMLIGTSGISKILLNQDDLLSKQATVEDAYKSAFMFDVDDVIDEELEKTKKELIENYYLEIIQELYYLKNVGDIGLCEIADYYIALGYLFNIFRSKLTNAESRLVGQEMLRMCLIMKNQYAEAYYSLNEIKNKENN